MDGKMDNIECCVALTWASRLSAEAQAFVCGGVGGDWQGCIRHDRVGHLTEIMLFMYIILYFSIWSDLTLPAAIAYSNG